MPQLRGPRTGGAEGVPGGTSRGPRAAFGCEALATRSVAAEGAGREDAVLSVTAAEGFVNNAGWALPCHRDCAVATSSLGTGQTLTLKVSVKLLLAAPEDDVEGEAKDGDTRCGLKHEWP